MQIWFLFKKMQLSLLSRWSKQSRPQVCRILFLSHNAFFLILLFLKPLLLDLFEQLWVLVFHDHILNLLLEADDFVGVTRVSQFCTTVDVLNLFLELLNKHFDESIWIWRAVCLEKFCEWKKWHTASHLLELALVARLFEELGSVLIWNEDFVFV